MDCDFYWRVARNEVTHMVDIQTEITMAIWMVPIPHSKQTSLDSTELGGTRGSRSVTAFRWTRKRVQRYYGTEKYRDSGAEY